ncbi:MAG: L,D-transpeptidase [Parcubacteria group bacterium]|nr:L,D-transpeptidase [Parcubacteria group bacterium]
MKRSLLILLAISFLAPPIPTHAYHSESVQIRSLDGSIDFSLNVNDTVGGVSMALSDLGNDGISEIVIGAGMGSEPRVRVLRQDGSEVGSFLAYAPTLGVGINVTTCDLTGDGYDEIVAAPQRGGGPHVRVFNRFGEAIDGGGFFAFGESFRGGVNLACGDLTGDARAELVTLPAAGGGPHVRIWSWNDGVQIEENFFAFGADDRGGLVGDVSDKNLFLTQQHTSSPVVRTFSFESSVVTKNEKQLFIDSLGVHSLVVHNKNIMLSTASSSYIYNESGVTQTVKVADGSVHIASDDNILLYTSGRVLFVPETDKRIEVNVTQQRLYASIDGILENSFLISSGLSNRTPLGNHVILAKVPVVHYAWNYGEGNPNNYDLGWIPYNLRIFPHIYIHYAPWHSNFGHQMSRGCVNVSLEDMRWIYEWAEEGITVVVKE